MPNKGVLIADDMGLGKTIQAIGVINSMPEIKNALVICPASVKLNWRRELLAWLARPFQVWPVFGQAWPDIADIIIINYDLLTKHEERLTEKEWDIAIADEIHFIKDPKTKRCKALQNIRAKYKLGLTGTPILNKMIDIFPALHWLDPETWRHPKQFQRKFCDEWGNSSADDRARLQKILRSSIMVRRLKADVMKEIPAKRRQVIEVEDTVGACALEQEIMQKNEELLESLETALELAKVSEVPGDYEAALNNLKDGVSVEFENMARIRHESAVAKLPLTLEHIQTCLQSVPKIVVWAHHRDCLERIQQEIPGTTLFYGGMSADEKQRAIDTFVQYDKCRVFAGSIRAAGMGIDGLQKVCSHSIIHEFDWVPKVMEQAEDRLVRIGQRDSVLFQYLVVSGTIDANMAYKQVEKLQLCDQCLDNDRERLLFEPIAPTPAKQSAVTVTKREIQDHVLDPAQRAAIHECLRMLALACDGARQRDMAGFNKVDANIGRALASYPKLTNAQALLGQKLCRRYRGQLPSELVEKAL